MVQRSVRRLPLFEIVELLIEVTEVRALRRKHSTLFKLGINGVLLWGLFSVAIGPELLLGRRVEIGTISFLSVIRVPLEEGHQVSLPGKAALGLDLLASLRHDSLQLLSEFFPLGLILFPSSRMQWPSRLLVKS